MNLRDWLKKQPEYRERRKRVADGWRAARKANRKIALILWRKVKDAEAEYAKYVNELLYGKKSVDNPE